MILSLLEMVCRVPAHLMNIFETVITTELEAFRFRCQSTFIFIKIALVARIINFFDAFVSLKVISSAILDNGQV